MSYRIVTPSGIVLEQTATVLDYATGIRAMVDSLDHELGGYLSSGIEYPGRYNRWEIGFVRPPLEFVAKDRELRVAAVNARGVVLIELFADILTSAPDVSIRRRDARSLVLEIQR